MDSARSTPNRQKEIYHISNDPNGSNGSTRVMKKIPKKNRAEKPNESIVKEFCLNTTLHGIRYFLEPNRHWIERIWWMTSFTLSVVFCVAAIASIWITRTNHPVIVTFDDKTTPISTIPFPAITICTSQKIRENITKIESDDEPSQNLFPGEESNVSIYETIKDISPGLSSVIDFSWGLHDRSLEFKPIFTEEGLCFTFNSMNSEEIYTDQVAPELLTVRENPNATNWNIGNGYQLDENVNEIEVFPYRAFDIGYHNSIMFISRITMDNSFPICSSDASFSITLHMPNEIADISKSHIHIPVEHDAKIFIKPQVMVTSYSLSSYKPHERGCYFHFEHQLRFFRSYSKQKCEIECLANFTKDNCECVPFYIPRDVNTKVCRFSEMNCFRSASKRFSNKLMVKSCDCLPDCTSITYDVEKSLVPYLENLQKRKINNGTSIKKGSWVDMTFKENYYISINRSETITISQFISNCGGLLGLFMGASVLSIIEMIYYFTLRLCCKFRRLEMIQTELGSLVVQ